MIFDLKFLPAGRILRNSLLPKGSLLNCYHKSIGDSIEEIANFIRDSLILWSEGGGMGTTLSRLRPSGADILGKGGHSSGPISFLQAIDATAATVESGGSRRAAGLAEMYVGHPDIRQFINAKNVDGVIQTFNLSVGVTGDFLDAVVNGLPWDLTFNQKLYDTVDAIELWEIIIHNMWKHAEPGLLNMDNLRVNNSYYFAPISGVNPCGEATLADDEACDLGSVVVANFVSNGGYTDWKGLQSTINTAVRFLDNILTVNNYTLDNIKVAVANSRRIGMGAIGLAEYFFKKKMRYGSPESIRESDKLSRFMSIAAYEASVRLAMEKGAFPKFEATAYGKAKYVRKLPLHLRKEIAQHGIRNCTLLAMPPTGTTSLLADCTSGIEPLYAKAYKRVDRVGERDYIHPLLIENGGDAPEWFVDSFDIQPKDHLEIQRAIQRHVDGSVSKTINIPKETTEEELSDLMLEYIYDLKGCTVYRDGSREGQILNRMSEVEIKQSLLTSQNSRTADDMQCATGVCDI
jgi:ribonucleoside-diphosphate reductase alpha chain